MVGNVWATRKHPGLAGVKLLLVADIECGSGKVTGEPALAVDARFGAGPGDTVLLVDEGNSARAILKNPSAPVRLAVAGIVDIAAAGGRTVQYH